MTDVELLKEARGHLNWIFFGGEFAHEMNVTGVYMCMAAHKEYKEALEFFEAEPWKNLMVRISAPQFQLESSPLEQQLSAALLNAKNAQDDRSLWEAEARKWQEIAQKATAERDDAREVAAKLGEHLERIIAMATESTDWAEEACNAILRYPSQGSWRREIRQEVHDTKEALAASEAVRERLVEALRPLEEFVRTHMFEQDQPLLDDLMSAISGAQTASAVLASRDTRTHNEAIELGRQKCIEARDRRGSGHKTYSGLEEAARVLESLKKGTPGHD